MVLERIRTSYNEFVTRRKITGIEKKWSKRNPRKEPYYSFEKALGKKYDATAVDIATRFFNKKIMNGINSTMKKEEKEIISRLVNYRPIRISRTNIKISEPQLLLELKLVNKIGFEKTSQALDSVVGEAKKIQKSYKKMNGEKEAKTDAFQHIAEKVGKNKLILEIYFKDPKQLEKGVKGFIVERKAQIEAIENSNLGKKEYYVRKFREQIGEAEKELASYKKNKKQKNKK